MYLMRRLATTTEFWLDSVMVFVAILVLGLLSNYLITGSITRGQVPFSYAIKESSGKFPILPTKQSDVLATAGSLAGSIFTVRIPVETPDRQLKVPVKVTLNMIESIKPESAPKNELLGSYHNAAGGVGVRILDAGGKAYRMTFTYINESVKAAEYDSGWSLQGPAIEQAVSKFEKNAFTYKYGQVPIWDKQSADQYYAQTHILMPGQKVQETVWFLPCPPLPECLIGDFELRQPVKISLP